MPRPDIDWLLLNLLDGVSLGGGELALTVFCGGLAVSGTAVPEEAYFRKVGLTTGAMGLAQIRETADEEVATIIEALKRDDLSIRDRHVLLDRMGDLGRSVIAMVDVTILGAGPSPIRAPGWRGQLSQISGWTLGAPETLD